MKIIELILLAIGLSMDTFSLSLAISMTKKNVKSFLPAITVGLYHFILPIVGTIISLKISNIININYNVLMGIVLLLISLSIIIEMIKKEESNYEPSFLGINFFALSVSIDAFAIGISFNEINVFASLIFFLFSSLFTYIGLRFGNYLNYKLGRLSNIIGLIVLLTLAILSFFK